MYDHLPSADAVAVETLGLDPFEIGLLAVLRHFLTAFARPETLAWQSAFALAAERWGEARGPQIAMGLLPVLQALRTARQSDFDFANPLCVTCRAYVTGTESAFMQMVQMMRRDQTKLARAAVHSLTDGTMDPGLIQAALAFAARHPAEAQEVSPKVSASDPWQSLHYPHLRLVH